MRCPKCGGRDDKVNDSRESREGETIRRRRECLHCGCRYTTYEEIEKPAGLLVQKRDGRHEPFSREKLLNSIAKACQKRPVALAAMQELAEAIYHEITSAYDREVPYRDVGERVMAGLRGLDKVAYVRYASIYRR